MIIHYERLRSIPVLLLIPLIFLVFAHPAAAAVDSEDGYDPGAVIFDHILDAHDWHIMDIGKTHVSIPLPVILIHKGKLYAFLSSKFHHGHDEYKGFKLMTKGDNKGKIVHVETGELPLDFSITKNVASLFISILFLSILLIHVGKQYNKTRGRAPRGVQSFLEPLILFVRDDIAKASIGEHRYERFVPFLLTLFFFIFFNNLLGLVPIFPGGANLTGNIGATAVLAGFTFLMTNFSGNKNYWMHIFNTPGVPWWLKFPLPLMPIIELLGVFTKPFVLTVRLFANITAGHLIVLGFISLIFIFGNISATAGYGISVLSVAFAIFISLLELLVAFIQAYVFTLLSSLYFAMATEDHH
ncbi:MAG: F0F1 ATP synthase subunit A [Bacteroidales bacterium]